MGWPHHELVGCRGLYFIEAGRHLAFGYVDQPPLTPLVDRIMDLLVGVTPTAVRVVPALAGTTSATRRRWTC